MDYSLSQDDLRSLAEAANEVQGPWLDRIANTRLRRLANHLFVPESSNLDQSEIAPWQLCVLSKLKWLFVTRIPQAPRLNFAGGILPLTGYEEGIWSRSISVSGVGLSTLDALSACAGETCEALGLFRSDQIDVLKVPPRQGSVKAGQYDQVFADRFGASDCCAPPDRVWSRALRLHDGTVHRVPAALSREPIHKEMAVPPSEGVGAGKADAAAQLHGMLELIERDAVCMWWYGGRPPKALPMSAEDRSHLQSWRSMVRDGQTGRTETLLDISGDLPVPVVAAVSWNEQGRQLACGSAARSEFLAAAKAAFREMCQMEFAYDLISLKRQVAGDTKLSQVDRQRLLQGELLKASALPMLKLNGQPIVGAEDQRSVSASEPEAFARQLIDFGIEFLATDISADESYLRVAKILSPQLQTGSYEVTSDRFKRTLKEHGGTQAYTSGLTLV